MRRFQRSALRIQELPAALERPLRLAVCGENNAGKSMLVNALVGQRVAATDFFEFTFCPMVIGYAARRGAWVDFEAQPTTEVAVEDLSVLLRNFKEDGRSAAVTRVRVGLPLPQLKRLEVADVPGVGADQRNAAVARAFQESVDAVAFVVNASLLGQSSLERDIRGLAREFRSCAVVVNKIDQIGCENAERAVAFLEAQNWGRPLPVFPMAAGLAVDPEEKRAPAPQARDWLAVFRVRFLEPIAQQAILVKADASLAKAERELTTAGNVLQTAYHTAVRAHGLALKAAAVLDEEQAEIIRKVTSQVSRWCEESAFLDVMVPLRHEVLSSRDLSQNVFEAKARAVFSKSVVQREAEQLARLVKNSLQEEWQRMLSRLATEDATVFSPFQIGQTAELLRRRSRENLESPPVTATPGAPVFPRSGTAATPILGEEDVTTSAAGGVVVGVVATAASVWLSTATVATAMSTVGLPFAVATGAGILFFNFLRRHNQRLTQLTPEQLDELLKLTRQDAAQRMLKQAFPAGVPALLEEQLVASRRTAGKNGTRASGAQSGDRHEELRELASQMAAGERLQQEFQEARQTVNDGRTSEHETAVAQSVPRLSYSAAAAKACFLFDEPACYNHQDGEKLRRDLQAVLAMEDSCVRVMDRSLGAAELAWFQEMPPATLLQVLVYDVERDTATRTEFVRALERLRERRVGEVAVRVVKFAAEDRTPLDRYLIAGSDWMLELSHSLSQVGRRELTVRSLAPLIGRGHAAATGRVLVRRLHHAGPRPGDGANDRHLKDGDAISRSFGLRQRTPE